MINTGKADIKTVVIAIYRHIKYITLKKCILMDRGYKGLYRKGCSEIS